VTRLPALARATDARCSLGVLALALVILGCTAPAVQESRAPSATVATIRSASAPPSTPTPTPTLEPKLAVVTVDGLNLREGPGMDQPIQTVGPGIPTSGEPIRLSANQRVWVIDTREVGGETWHHVVVEFSFMPGWISGGPATDPWITPFDPATCPPSMNDELDGPGLDRDPMRSLVCFGGEPVTLFVYWPTPKETGAHVPCPWGEPRWLLCYENVYLTEDGTRSLTVYGTTELPAFERGAWVNLVGHFDDTRSEGCPEALGRPPEDTGEVAASVLFCRTRFVADAVNH